MFLRLGRCPALLLLAGACSAVETGPPAISSDSAGVAMVTNDLRAAGALPTCELAPTARIRIGVAEGPPELEFGRVPSVAMLANGGLAVIDRSAKELRIFDSKGEFVRRIGRRGEGPGEFTDPIRVVAIGLDSLVVWDWGLERVGRFAPDGALVSDVAIRPPLGNPEAWFVVTEGSRRYWLGTTVFRMPEVGTLVPRPVRVLAVDEGGELRDTIGEYPGSMVGWVDQAARMTGQPLHDFSTSIAGGGSLLYLGIGNRQQYEVRDTAWNLVRVVRWLEPSRAVSAEDDQLYRRSFLADLASDAEREGWKSTLAAMPSADSFPTLTELLTSGDGVTWVRRYRRVPGDSATFWTFDPEGKFRCEVRLPAELRLRSVSATALAGVQEDSTGVPQVVLFDIAPSKQTARR